MYESGAGTNAADPMGKAKSVFGVTSGSVHVYLNRGMAKRAEKSSK
jgi:hypothetical protein